MIDFNVGSSFAASCTTGNKAVDTKTALARESSRR